MFLTRLHQAFDDFDVDYCLVGGHAVALHGAVRGTLDVDFVTRLEESQFVAIEKALASLGLTSQIPLSAAEIFRQRESLIRDRHLVAWSFTNLNDPSELVDILITEDLALMKTEVMTVAGQAITIAGIDDLIAMKKRSGRRQDLADIEALEKLK